MLIISHRAIKGANEVTQRTHLIGVVLHEAGSYKMHDWLLKDAKKTFFISFNSHFHLALI